MIRFARLFAGGVPDAQTLATHPEADAAMRLLSGQRPRRLASTETLLRWAAEATATPEFLLTASLAASGDKSEVAALLLPAAEGTPPGLSETLAALEAASQASEADRRAVWLALAGRLPPVARMVLNRLAAGTFRLVLKPEIQPQEHPRTFRALLTMVAPQGPEASFALRHGNGLVPIVKLPLTLTETPEILAWARAHTIERFGPNLAILPELVFTLTCAGTTANLRRKSGLDLALPMLVSWDRDAAPDQVTTLDAFKSI